MQNNEKLTFDLIAAIFGAKKDIKIWALRAHSPHTPKVVAIELENQGKIICKINEKLAVYLILALFRAKDGPKIWPLWAHILHTSKSSPNELKNKFHVNRMETFCKTNEKSNRLMFDLIWAL